MMMVMEVTYSFTIEGSRADCGAPWAAAVWRPFSVYVYIVRVYSGGVPL